MPPASLDGPPASLDGPARPGRWRDCPGHGPCRPRYRCSGLRPGELPGRRPDRHCTRDHQGYPPPPAIARHGTPRRSAYRGDRLAGLVEGLHQLQHLVVQAQVFRGTATGNQQPVIVGGIDLGEIEIQREQMTGLLAVGLVPLEIMDRSAHGLSRGLARAYRMHLVTDHLQRLERHHHFVVFDVIANQHQDLFRSHGGELL